MAGAFASVQTTVSGRATAVSVPVTFSGSGSANPVVSFS